jgi:hypothetical protein
MQSFTALKQIVFFFSVLFYLKIVARQRFGKNVTAATNAHATIEELLDA